MNVLVLTPDKEIFNGKATSVKATGLDGSFEVLNNHAPMVSALAAGTVRILVEGGQRTSFQIQRGYLEVLRNEVTILVQGVVEGEA